MGDSAARAPSGILVIGHSKDQGVDLDSKEDVRENYVIGHSEDQSVDLDSKEDVRGNKFRGKPCPGDATPRGESLRHGPAPPGRIPQGS